jgi:hypothetical protein
MLLRIVWNIQTQCGRNVGFERMSENDHILSLFFAHLTPEMLLHASSAFKNYTFCPHRALVCFIWISEQRAIISLHNINVLVFIIEVECVYCAVRTDALNIIHIHVRL